MKLRNTEKTISNLILIKLLIITVCLLAMFFVISEPSISRDCFATHIFEVDEEIQAITDDVLAKSIHTTKSNGGSIILKEIGSKKLLAISGSSNSIADSCGNTSNPAITAWEPGSIIKPLTLQATINEQGLGFQDEIFVKREIVIDKKTIFNHSIFEEKNYSPQEIINKSINTGAVSIFQKLSDNDKETTRNAIWHEYLTNIYKFGQSMNEGILEEDTGYVPPLYGIENSNYRLAQTSFGIGFLATPLQVIRAYEIGLTNTSLFSDQSSSSLKTTLRNNTTKPEISLGNNFTYGGKTGTSSNIDKTGRYNTSDTGAYIGLITKNATQEKNYILMVQLINPDTTTNRELGASKQAAKVWKILAEKMHKNNLL